MSIGEILQQALTNTLLGMGTVFLMLALIAVIIWILGFFGREGKPSAQQEALASRDAISVAPASAEGGPEADGDPLIPVIIAAAIAAYEADHGIRSATPQEDGYIVRSIRRRKWKHTLSE